MWPRKREVPCVDGFELARLHSRSNEPKGFAGARTMTAIIADAPDVGIRSCVGTCGHQHRSLTAKTGVRVP